MRSLKARLVGLWGLSILSSLVLGVLLVTLYAESTEAQVGRAQAVLARSCDLIRDRYAFYVTNWTGPVDGLADPTLRRDLAAVTEVALARQEGVEGGIWASGTGSLAYAYPTYEGSGPKTDLPLAESDQIAGINATALREDRTVGQTQVSRSQTLLLAACPLSGPVMGLTGWTMARVQRQAGFGTLQLGLSSLLALLVVTTVLLGRTMLVWGRHVRGIEAALGGVDAAGLPSVDRPGERELDRIVDALNQAGRRLAEARRESEAMASRVARAERMGALGRVAAGVAHEIRNPLAAARLQGENALAGDDRRRQDAIADMLVQLDRLDGLVSELLAMTQRVQPAPVLTDIGELLGATALQHRDAAADREVVLTVAHDSSTACLDPLVVGRILDNLVANAIRHARPGGIVRLSGRREPHLLTLAVADDGPGVPAEMAERLFEPFVTGRPDGTGLGLAIARELADAHGGRLLLRNPGGGPDGKLGGSPDGNQTDPSALTDFALELPQGREQAPEDRWPRS